MQGKHNSLVRKIALAFSVLAMALTFSLVTPVTSQAQSGNSGWRYGQNGWWYQLASGGYKANSWAYLNSQWYHFDKMGWMQTGWQYINGNWYYFDLSSGHMQTDWLRANGHWYYLDADNGNMLTGWQPLNGYWYYLSGANGRMLTGWQRIGGAWYYLAASGALKVDTWVGNYYVNKTGAWVPGITPPKGCCMYPSTPAPAQPAPAPAPAQEVRLMPLEQISRVKFAYSPDVPIHGQELTFTQRKDIQYIVDALSQAKKLDQTNIPAYTGGGFALTFYGTNHQIQTLVLNSSHTQFQIRNGEYGAAFANAPRSPRYEVKDGFFAELWNHLLPSVAIKTGN